MRPPRHERPARLSDPPVGAAPSEPAVRPRRLANLRNGAALMLLRRRDPADFARSFDQMLGLLLINVLLWVVLEWWQHANADATLGLEAFLGLGCYGLMALLGCALIARVNSREAEILALLIPVLSVLPFVQLLLRLGAVFVPAGRSALALALGLLVVYLCVLSWQVLHAAYGRVRMGAGLLAMLLIAASPLVFYTLDLQTALWVADEEDEADAQNTIEPLLYAQPERIATAVQRVLTQPREGGAVYFLGFAGDGGQGIFRREVLVAEHSIARHFGAEGRSLALINDVEDRESYPLATVTGLAQALKLLGERIHPAQDVVVLALTSHGSPEALEVSNGELPLLQLTPQDLRQALDEAGIQWRVVIVSACYSGVFVNALKDDNTLVITAADSSHSSFGCDDERELTWFGEAFFKEALPGSDTLAHAFGRASALIRERETAQKLTHSNPQIFVGPRIKARLAALEPASPAVVHLRHP